jgi:hypothetical protein
MIRFKQSLATQLRVKELLTTKLSVFSKASLGLEKYNNYRAATLSANKFVIPNIIPSGTMKHMVSKGNQV